MSRVGRRGCAFWEAYDAGCFRVQIQKPVMQAFLALPGAFIEVHIPGANVGRPTSAHQPEKRENKLQIRRARICRVFDVLHPWRSAQTDRASRGWSGLVSDRRVGRSLAPPRLEGVARKELTTLHDRRAIMDRLHHGPPMVGIGEGLSENDKWPKGEARGGSGIREFAQGQQDTLEPT